MGTVRPTPAALKSPLVVCLWVTGECNLACRYCYAHPLGGGIMPSDRMFKLADELVSLEVFDVTIAGGEPLLHPDILPLIDRLLSGGVTLGLLSNGALLDEEMTERLVATVADRENFLLQISVDGTTPDIHDRTRGQGRRILRNLRHVCNATDLRLQIATVINAYNVENIPELIDTFYPRVKRFHFMNLQRTTQSLHAPDLFITHERSERFWRELEEMMKLLPRDILVTGLNLMRLMTRMEENPSRHRLHSTFDCPSCTSGVTHVEITSSLDVIGCDIAKEYTVMGNLRDATLLDIWHSERADLVRSFPFPPCYFVRDPKGCCLADSLPTQLRSVGEEILRGCE